MTCKGIHRQGVEIARKFGSSSFKIRQKLYQTIAMQETEQRYSADKKTKYESKLRCLTILPIFNLNYDSVASYQYPHILIQKK